jgi:lipopolysaccharide export LptBFGC system permease protein LptF
MMKGGLLVRSFERSAGPAPPPIDVEAALWHERQWLAAAQSFHSVTEEKREPVYFDGEPLPLVVTPGQLLRGKEDPTLKSSRALKELASQLARARQRLLVILHGRVAFPLASFVLLLVAIPFVFQSEGGKSTWIGVGLALVISLGFYFLNYACRLLGQYPKGVFAGAPALAAWLPILLFGALGAIMMYRIDT